MADRVEPIFFPRSIAVIGASRHKGKVGYAILRNLLVNEFQGTLYPVNPNADSVQGIKAYPSIGDVPDPVDLAIVTVPADAALEAVEACGKKGVRGLVVITAGFREIGGVGAEREKRLVELVKRYGMVLVGPNCMGVINTHPDVQMDATFAPTPPLRGHISFLSQSGALGVAILDHARNLKLGFAKFASLGNKADVSGNDLLVSWEDDPETKVILMYLENFGNPKNFVRIARRVTKKKPVIAVKAGRTEAGGRATASQTGSLGGSDIAAEAAFTQTGVLRANSIEELFDYAMAFARQPLPKGKRVAIVTDAGGPAIMCTDFLIENGMEVAALSEATVASMRAWAPPEASLRNPVDLIASAGAEEYRKAVGAVLADDNVDAVIAIYVPPIVTEEVNVA
ncbi:MAG TPA: CoA-binding protein, partial [Thermoplasmata archaeon]|nr:CoA-binding protein [Thermoplasmata archaeon]